MLQIKISDELKESITLALTKLEEDENEKGYIFFFM